MFFRVARVACILSMVFLCAKIAVAVPHYVTLDVGDCALSNFDPFPVSVNASGQVVGIGADYHAFLYKAGTRTDIGSLFAYNPNTLTTAINNSGVAVGFSKPPSPSPRGFIYSGGTMTNMGTLPGVVHDPGPTPASRPMAINATGQIAGIGGGGAFFYDGTNSFQISASLGGNNANNQAYGINKRGQVVGGSQMSGADPSLHGFMWDWVPGVMTPTGGTVAYGINDSGVVVGYSSTPTTRAFLSTANSSGVYTPTLLPLLGSGISNSALAIGNTGDVVGWSSIDSGDSIVHAFLYTGGTMADLNALISPTLGWTLVQATTISSDGKYLAGYGTIGGATHAFRLQATLPGDANLDGAIDISDLSKVLTNYDKAGMTWADGDFDGSGSVDITDLSNVLTNYDKSLGASVAGIKAVPEPSTLLLLAIGLVGLLACARQKWN